MPADARRGALAPPCCRIYRDVPEHFSCASLSRSPIWPSCRVQCMGSMWQRLPAPRPAGGSMNPYPARLTRQCSRSQFDLGLSHPSTSAVSTRHPTRTKPEGFHDPDHRPTPSCRRNRRRLRRHRGRQPPAPKRKRRYHGGELTSGLRRTNSVAPGGRRQWHRRRRVRLSTR